MKAIVLLSGGIDSIVVLADALESGRECAAISFDYGQRHKYELTAAEAIASHYGVKHHLFFLDPAIFLNSSLIAKSALTIPKNRTSDELKASTTPSTYVPARNTLFLSVAMAQAESLKAEEIHFGANAMDRQYPDCHPFFFEAFQELIHRSRPNRINEVIPKIITPLIQMDKSSILNWGKELKVPFHLTFSCYDPRHASLHCGQCDACLLRKAAFIEVGILDPTKYIQ